MKALTDKLSQFQALIALILGILATFGFDKAGFVQVLRNPLEWGIWEPLFLAAVLLSVCVALVRQIYAGASQLKDPNALRLDPAEPRLLLGRKDDIARVARALQRRLIFLVGESGSGKTALLQAGVLLAPEVIREFVPVYIDLTDQDWDDGLLMLIRDRFRLALPDDEKREFAASDCASAEDLLAAFDLYRQRLGRQPLLIFDQFDDYAAHHFAHLRDPDLGAWRDAKEVATENAALQLVHDGLAQRRLTALFASRSEDQGSLETVRTLTNHIILPLYRPPTGSAGPIIDAVTTAQTPGQVVIENPDATWPALNRRMVEDLERTGQVLPQQLKLVLQGLRSLSGLTVGAYERAGRINGLEAASVRDALAAAARGSSLSAPVILGRVLFPLVDSERRPPGKARPRSVAQLANPGLDPASVADVLASLGNRKIVSCAGDPNDKAAVWQLDHEYLARPILRLRAEQEKWAILLAERATSFQEAGLSISRRWRSLLSLSQQIGVLTVRLRRRLRYGTATGMALASLAASIVWVATLLSALGAMGWAAWQYNEAARIEASLGGVRAKDDFSDYALLTGDQREALLDLANGGLLTRRLVMHDIFVRPQQATAFSARTEEMLRALTGLDANSTARFVTSQSQDDLKIPDRSDPAFRVAWARLVSIGVASLPTADPHISKLLGQILARIKLTTNAGQLKDLAKAYKAVVDKLPATDLCATGLLDQILAASKLTRDSHQIVALAEAYKAVADKLPAADLRADGLLDQILATAKRTTYANEIKSLAEAYKGVADKLPAADSRAGDFLDQILVLSKLTGGPYFLKILADAYKTVADKLPAAGPRAGGFLEQILSAAKRTTDADQLFSLAEAYKALADASLVVDLRAAVFLDQIIATAKRTTNVQDLNILAKIYETVADTLPVGDPCIGGILDQIVATSKPTTDESELDFLANAYKAVAKRLSAADPRSGGLLDQILTGIELTANFRKLFLLNDAYKVIADKLPTGDQRASGFLDQILAATKQTSDADQLNALAKVYRIVASKLPVADQRASGLLDQILDMSKLTTDALKLAALAKAYNAFAYKLPTAGSRAGSLLDQILVVSKQTTDSYQLKTLADAYKTVADMMPAADPRTNGLLDQIFEKIKLVLYDDRLDLLIDAYATVADTLPGRDPRADDLLARIVATIKLTTDAGRLNALVRAYKAVANKLPATDLRGYSRALRDIRGLATDADDWRNVAQAELLLLPALSIDDAMRLISDLLRDPLCVEENQAAVLAAFAYRLDKEADPKIKPNKPWGDEVWAFVAWAKKTGGFDPDRISQLD